ncbi:hypothetical protein JXQ70_04515 [bacterium]|nr:hypothetical protein [bacterium]
MALPIPSMSRLAKDIAEGYIQLTVVMFRGTPVDKFKTLQHELTKLLQEVRGTAVDLEDFQALKAKNTKISRLNHALVMLKNYCRERKIYF